MLPVNLVDEIGVDSDEKGGRAHGEGDEDDPVDLHVVLVRFMVRVDHLTTRDRETRQPTTRQHQAHVQLQQEEVCIKKEKMMKTKKRRKRRRKRRKEEEVDREEECEEEVEEGETKRDKNVKARKRKKEESKNRKKKITNKKANEII